MAEIKTNAMRVLDKLKIDYVSHFYDVEDGKIDGVSVAHKVGLPVEIVYKTLITQAGKNFYVFIIPVAEELSLKACAKAVGEKSIEMLKPADLLKTTGYIRGGCSPIGMKKIFTTVIDSAVNNIDKIVVSGGKIGCQIEITPKDLLKVIPYNVAEITM